MKLSLAQILLLVGAGLGLVNLFMGLAPAASGGGISQSLYEVGVGWLPVLFFIGGLLAITGLLPKGTSLGVVPAVVVLGAVLGHLFSFSAIPSGGSTGVGFIMILVFGIVELAALVVSYLFEVGILKPPAPNPYGHQPPGMYPPSGQFPAQQPGPFPPQGPPGQQTTFAPQQGQFGQPQQPPPGTPPGGYPQQQG
ncbi:DUF5336 domain-containing protein [Actinophytocola sp.]|uniref:DUF5336 domain-containing protein n=1 Tax=Actinophytocola sp. TaxID=1872138 RepID=UPI002ED82BB0